MIGGAVFSYIGGKTKTCELPAGATIVLLRALRRFRPSATDMHLLANTVRPERGHSWIYEEASVARALASLALNCCIMLICFASARAFGDCAIDSRACLDVVSVGWRIDFNHDRIDQI